MRRPFIIGRLALTVSSKKRTTLKMSFFLAQLPDRLKCLVVICLVGVGGVWLAACTNSADNQTSEPAITLNPQSGGAGTSVTVTGHSFPAGTAVMLRLGPPDVGATPFSYASAVTDPAGSFSLAFQIPERWPDDMPITETQLTVIALNDDGSLKATAPFTFQPGLSAGPTLTSDAGNVTTPDPLLIANEQAVVAAVMNHLVQTGESTQVAVSVEQMEGEFARVNIIPVTADSPGPSTGYLKLVNSLWEVLVIGRDFDSDQLQELGIPTFIIPPSLLTPEG
jgi:hypothetical protein